MNKNLYSELLKGTAEDFRLPLQHFLFQTHFGYNINPGTGLQKLESPRIAEVACGTCIWQLQVAKELPDARVDGFDMTLELCPPAKSLPSNVTITEWNVFDPLPKGTEGIYDLVHVRFLIAGLPKGSDIDEMIQKFGKMLKPGGWLQWEEAASMKLHYDANREPSEAIKADIEKLGSLTLNLLAARTSVDLTTELPSLLENNGFETVNVDKADGVDPAWLKTWHRMTMMTMQFTGRALERMGDMTGWDVWNRIEKASNTDEGTFVYYLPGSTIGRKPEH